MDQLLTIESLLVNLQNMFVEYMEREGRKDLKLKFQILEQLKHKSKIKHHIPGKHKKHVNCEIFL